MTEEQLKVYHKKPLIFTIDKILTPDECQLIINKCKDKWSAPKLELVRRVKFQK